MARAVTAEHEAILEKPFSESFNTLQVNFPNGQVLRLAGADITPSNAAPFTRNVVRGSNLRQPLGGSADVVSMVVANTDWSHSRRILETFSNERVSAVVGRLHRDKRANGPWIWRARLSGFLVSVVSNEAEATFTVVSDIAAAGQVGATRLIALACQWIYRSSQCGYTGHLPTCDFTFELATGCEGRDQQHRFSGQINDASKLTLILPGPAPGGDPAGGGGGGTGGGPPDGDKIPIDYPY